MLGAVLLACVLSKSLCDAGIGVMPGSEGDGVLSALLRLADEAVVATQAAHERMPILVMVLSALLVVPALAVASLLVRGAMRSRVPDESPTVIAARGWTRDPGGDPPPTPLPGWPTAASIRFDAPDAAPIVLGHGLLRIGRHDDNELRLAHASVHRYHAIIHATSDAEYLITDVSGSAGNGVRVNGRRLAQARLTDGDYIELGAVRLRFDCAPH